MPKRRVSETRIEPVPVKKRTGFNGERWRGIIEQLRPGYYRVSDQRVAGAAPKDFVYVYEFAPGVRKNDQRTWPAYIAKVGNKWYPAESITEQLMTRIGESLGIRMAASKLMYSGDQIRFLSRYFLSADESLVHGAEIVAGHLEDPQFVTNVGEEHLEPEIFTFQVLYEAIISRFPVDAEHILRDFVRMIGFDALAGNQDRHLYNWGVIVHPTGAESPRFSPIYDSARGLFWNTSEERLSRYGTPEALRAYILGAHPLIGWDGQGGIGHFELVTKISSYDSDLANCLRQIDLRCLPSVCHMIDTEFDRLLSRQRRELIKQCLTERFHMFESAIAREE